MDFSMRSWALKLPSRMAAVRFFEFISRTILALVFLKSGLGHLANSYFFLSSIYAYELVGPAAAESLGLVLPTFQVLVAFCLLGQSLRGGALLVSLGTLSAFTVAQVWALANGLNIDCGCFGVGEDQQMISNLTLLRTSLLLVLALGAFLVWVSEQTRSCRGTRRFEVPSD